MSFFANLFGTESAGFWRRRAESLEKKLDDERERHRVREEFLLDEVLKMAAAKPIRAEAERKADINGFEAAFALEQKRELKKKETELEEAERQAFVADSIKNGVDADEARKYFDENKQEILMSAV